MSKVRSGKKSLKAVEISASPTKTCTVTLRNYFSTHPRLIELQAAEKRKRKKVTEGGDWPGRAGAAKETPQKKKQMDVGESCRAEKPVP